MMKKPVFLPQWLKGSSEFAILARRMVEAGEAILEVRPVAVMPSGRMAHSHCKAGHLMEGVNVYRYATGNRGCVQCRRIRQRALKAKLLKGPGDLPPKPF